MGSLASLSSVLPGPFRRAAHSAAAPFLQSEWAKTENHRNRSQNIFYNLILDITYHSYRLILLVTHTIAGGKDQWGLRGGWLPLLNFVFLFSLPIGHQGTLIISLKHLSNLPYPLNSPRQPFQYLHVIHSNSNFSLQPQSSHPSMNSTFHWQQILQRYYSTLAHYSAAK